MEAIFIGHGIFADEFCPQIELEDLQLMYDNWARM